MTAQGPVFITKNPTKRTTKQCNTRVSNIVSF